MNEKTYHISPKKLAEAEALTTGIYPDGIAAAASRVLSLVSFFAGPVTT
jgi:hypothetical protein